MAAVLSTTPQRGDTRLRLWKRILQYYQNLPGALAHNNPSDEDTIRATLVKLLRALNNV